MTNCKIAWSMLPLCAGLLLLIATNSQVTYYDDEVMIIDHATLPTKQILQHALEGAGIFEHPPLTDILLSQWLPFCSDSQLLIRLPSMLFYIVGVFLMARSAMMVAGGNGRFLFFACWWAALWPYGFLMGRTAGWYSISFFFFNTIVYWYLKFIRGETKRSALLMLLFSLLLIYSNYFGLFLCALMGVDYLLFQNRTKRGLLYTLCFGITLAILYAPIWPPLIRKLGNPSPRDSFVSSLANMAYTFIAAFTGETVAPWVWYFVPVAIGLLMLLISLARGKDLAIEKRFGVYFILALIVLCATGSLTTKRVFFFSAWFVIPLMSLLYRVPTRVVWSSFIVVLGVSWFAMINKSSFGTLRYIEPWDAIAKAAAEKIESRENVGSGHQTFGFYLNYHLAPVRAQMKQRGYLPGSFPKNFVVSYSKAGFTPTKGRFHLFSPPNAVNVSSGGKPCSLESEAPLFVDPGAEFKKKWFPTRNQNYVRISHRIYRCD